MKTMTVGSFKAEFSSVVDDLKRGRKVMITYGRKKVPLATIIPQSELTKPNHAIKVGDLKSKGWNYSMKDFEMTDTQLLGQ